MSVHDKEKKRGGGAFKDLKHVLCTLFIHRFGFNKLLFVTLDYKISHKGWYLGFVSSENWVA